MPHRRRFMLAALVLVAASGLAAEATRRPLLVEAGQRSMVHSSDASTTTSRTDTLVLYGGPGTQEGKFEDAGGQPDWQGWTHEDPTFNPETFWQVSDFMPPSGQYAMWCGTAFDDGPGYGNSWSQKLVFTHTVNDPAQPSTVHWTAILQHDTEPGYDFVHLEVNRGGAWETLQSVDDRGLAAIDLMVNLEPGDLVGEGLDEIQLRVLVESDGAWSDEDGLWPTDGACQYDDVTVTVDGMIVDHEDFEDQVSQRWQQVLDPGVGDFAALYAGLQDVDECRSNSSVQVAFIDNGIVVPGTGGTPCVTWCYGPGGFIVNHSGGLLGDPWHLHNVISSPVIPWPEGYSGGRVAFDAYVHENLGSLSSGIFWLYRWQSDDNPDLDAPWGGFHVDTFVQFGGPEYRRYDLPVTGALYPGLTRFRFMLEVMEIGWMWGWYGEDGTPAPYFDNVSIKAWRQEEPEITARIVDLANDAFPASGDLDVDNPVNNSVRFDAARNISPPEHLRNDPGDSVVVRVAVARPGAELLDVPRMHVRMQANPIFDGVRILPPGFDHTGGIVTGTVPADSVVVDGNWWQETWSFDLPDTGFFYPGDVIHYYIEARNILDGDVATATLPADTTGFASFAASLRYDSDFVVRALPTLFSLDAGDQPEFLLWNDFGDRGGANAWFYALGNLAQHPGRDYDVYTTRAPSSGVGNGLGGRATSAQLAGYATLIYSSGDLTENLLSNGDFQGDPSDDLTVVSNWFGQENKRAFMTGDNLASGLLESGAQGAAFVNTYLNVNPISPDLRPYIGNQTAPRVVPIQGNGVIPGDLEWIAYGGCSDINRFDAVEANAGAIRLAQFTDPSGQTGVYPYAAMVHNVHHVEDASVVFMPHDFATILNAPGWAPPPGYPPIPARAVLLDHVLEGIWWSPGVIGVTPDAPLRIAAYPNPFNPATTIALDLPRAGQVRLAIYDLRGQLVRTLVDERLAAGHREVVWDGTADRGATVASGVYVAEVRAGGEVGVHKLVLVK